MYIVWDRIIQIEYFVFSCVRQVPSIDFYLFPAYVGFIGDHFFLLSTDSTYSLVLGDQGRPIFFRPRDFFWWSFYVQIGVLQLYHVSNLGLAMAWKWIRISLESRMGCPDGSGTKTKSYVPVSQIACVSVSNVLVLIVHISVYLGSRGKPFFWNLKFS